MCIKVKGMMGITDTQSKDANTLAPRSTYRSLHTKPSKKMKCLNTIFVEFSNTKLTLRLLMSYIYGAPILDVSRSHTTTQHSR